MTFGFNLLKNVSPKGQAILSMIPIVGAVVGLLHGFNIVNLGTYIPSIGTILVGLFLMVEGGFSGFGKIVGTIETKFGGGIRGILDLLVAFVGVATFLVGIGGFFGNVALWSQIGMVASFASAGVVIELFN